MQVTSAYGRKYSTIGEAKKDWKSGKDFKILGGPYMSKNDWSPLDSIYIIINGKMEFLEVGLI